MATKPRKLAPKEQLFVAEYLVTLNGADAYCKAGYKAKNANVASVCAHQLLRKPNVAAAVAEGQAKKLERAGISADRVIAEIAKVGFASMRRFVTIDADGQPQINLSATPDDDLDALSEIATETVVERKGNDESGKPQFDTIRKTKIKLYDKLNALEKLAQHTGVYKKRDEDMANALARAVIEIQARTSRAPIRRDIPDDGDA